MFQQRLRIIGQSSMYWQEEIMHNIMYASVILYNMIVEYKKDHNLLHFDIL